MMSLGMRCLRTLAVLAGMLLLGAAQAQSEPEAQLQNVIDAVLEGRLGAALGDVDRLVSRYPNFRLAQLLRGDLLLAHAGRITKFGNTGHGGERLNLTFQAEAQ